MPADHRPGLKDRTIEFDGGMLLVADAERLLLLNESASRIWKGLAAGLTPDEIAAALAEGNGEDAAAIQADVGMVVAQANALLGEPSAPTSPAVPPLSGEPIWAAQWMCRVRGRQFSLAVENPAHGRQLKLLLGHLEVEDGVAEMRLEVRDAGSGRSVIVQDGRERARISGIIGLRGTIHAAMIERLWPDRPFCALIHGGAVALGETGICFPAFAGSGKTTLIAHLIGRGFDYLSDDLTPVDASGTMLPWPMPLSVKQGSWRAIEQVHPGLSDEPSFETLKGTARLLMPQADIVRDEPTRLGALVFPQYREDAQTDMVELRPFEALERLYKAGIWLGHPLDPDRVRQFLAWLRRTPAFSLTYSRLNEAESEILCLLAADSRSMASWSGGLANPVA